MVAPLTARLYPGDEELGKKDDDYKLGSKSPLSSVWQHRRPSIRKQAIKRLFIGVGVLALLYFFFKNMPTDLGNRSGRPTYTHSSGHQNPNHALKPNTAKQSEAQDTHRSKTGTHGEESNGVGQYSYNGPIKFYQLAATIKAISQTRGYNDANQNVLFAASNLKSAAILLPIACEMATWKRNFVHFVIMGRDDMSMDILKAVNGMEDGCGIWFHGM